MLRKCLSVLVIVSLVLVGTTPAFAAVYYYYEGIVNTSASSTSTGYYMGKVTSTNTGPHIATIFYEQSTSATKSSSISGRVMFSLSVKSDALAVANGSLSATYTQTETWQSGTRKGGSYQQSPNSYAELSAYLWKATVTGQEKVRVEEAGGGGGWADAVGNDSGIESVSYIYNSFTTSYPSSSDFHLHYWEQAL